MTQRIPCYEYLNCDQAGCRLFNQDQEVPCWILTQHEYTHPFVQHCVDMCLVPSIEDKCDVCLYHMAFTYQE